MCITFSKSKTSWVSHIMSKMWTNKTAMNVLHGLAYIQMDHSGLGLSKHWTMLEIHRKPSDHRGVGWLDCQIVNFIPPCLVYDHVDPTQPWVMGPNGQGFDLSIYDRYTRRWMAVFCLHPCPQCLMLQNHCLWKWGNPNVFLPIAEDNFTLTPGFSDQSSHFVVPKGFVVTQKAW